LSALAVFILWSAALLMVTVGITEMVFTQAEDTVLTNSQQLFVMAVVYAAIGMLTLPSVYYALWRVLGLKAIDLRSTLARFDPILWIVALPVVLLVGYYVSGKTLLAWFVLPFLHIVAVGLPIFWLLYLSIRNLPIGSPQRMWGIFTSGLLLAPSVALILEGLIGLVLLFFVILYISSRPDLVEQISRVADWMNLTNPSPELLFEEISPMVVQPLVILSILFFGSIVVPLIEEAIKPIGVWLLVGKKLPSAAGFVAGALSGAAYAMIESLVLTSDGQQWISMMVARIGTAIIHILTSGLVGWALVQIRQKRGFVLLFTSYIVAVILHGMWNALTLFSTFSILSFLRGLQLPYAYIYNLGWIAPFGLIFLASGSFVTLLYANRLLRHSRIMIQETWRHSK
jgi:hypothetical protein